MADNLRKFKEADRLAVLELSRHALSRPEEQVGNPVWETREELDSELAGWDRDPSETLRVVEEGRRVVGFGGVEVPAGWEHADLFGPIVAEEYRGQRLARRLLETSIEIAESFTVPRIIGSVGTRNAQWRVLLERCGFKPSGKARAIFRLTPESHKVVEPPAGVEVRPGMPDDIDAALALYQECFPEGRFPEHVWRDGLERGTVFLAEESDRVLAFLDIDPSDRWIYHLGVTESARSRGVGAALASAALESYWEGHPAEPLGLTVPADNLPATRLFRKQGFMPFLVLQSFELRLG